MNRIIEPSPSRLEIASLIRRYGSPLLIGRASRVIARLDIFKACLPDMKIRYAVKANTDPELLRVILQHDTTNSFDIAGIDEFDTAVEIGSDPKQFIIGNPVKSDLLIESALRLGSRWLVVDTADEVRRIDMIQRKLHLPASSQLLLRVRVAGTSSRVDLNARFGVDCSNIMQRSSSPELDAIVQAIDECELKLGGLSMHVGSQCYDLADFADALEHIGAVEEYLSNRGYSIGVIDIGGGIPVDYSLAHKVDDIGLNPDAMNSDHDRFLAGYLSEIQRQRSRIYDLHKYRDVEWIIEPGRAVVADAVSLLTSVIGKRKLPGDKFAYTIDDGIYGSFSGRYFEPDHFAFHPLAEGRQSDRGTYSLNYASTIYGPTCDAGDVVARQASLPELFVGDHLITPMCGAYAAVSATNFNGCRSAHIVWID